MNVSRGAMLVWLYKRLWIFNNGQICWPCASIAEKLGPFKDLPGGRAFSVIRFDSPAYEANLRAGQAIMRSGIVLNGVGFGAALEHRPP